MFKEYEFAWNDGFNERKVSFFVHGKMSRNGLVHRACALGPIPRTDGDDIDVAKYIRNTHRLDKARVQRLPYVNRTWEYYPGQTCLFRLWEKLAKLKFTNMAKLSVGNPFDTKFEPDHKEMYLPEDIFGRFDRRRA